ncbi:hypothetical protein GCM10027259_53750 [Micromonospora palomenae]
MSGVCGQFVGRVGWSGGDGGVGVSLSGLGAFRRSEVHPAGGGAGGHGVARIVGAQDRHMRGMWERRGRRGVAGPRAVGAVATGALAVGARAIGAAAIGSLAVSALAGGATALGVLAIGRLAVRRAVIRELRIGRLEVDELIVHGRADPTRGGDG